MNIWEFQSKLTRRLLIWSLFSVIFGGLLQFPRVRFIQGLGQQFTGWGIIDALIAIFGQRAAENRHARLPDPLSSEIIEGETKKLSKILWINTGLDVGYIVGGTVMAFTKGKTNPGWRGHGIGVIIQGGFLLLFDLFHAWKLGRP
jgi:hypothetical protein